MLVSSEWYGNRLSVIIEEWICFVKLALKLDSFRDPDCELCPLHEGTDRVCVMGNPPTKFTTVGGKKVLLAVVGEAPGGNEERTGQLFSGAAGQLLWAELKILGIE